MDPISVIGLLASLTNLVQSAHSIVKTIRTFKEGAKELDDLLGSVSVFSEALQGFDRILRSRQAIHHVSKDIIATVLVETAETIANLEKNLAQISNSEAQTIRRIKWVQSRSSFIKIHNKLKEQNAMLQTFLMMSHAQTFFSVIKQNPDVLLPVEEGIMSPYDSTRRHSAPDTTNDGSNTSAFAGPSLIESVSSDGASVSSLSALRRSSDGFEGKKSSISPRTRIVENISAELAMESLAAPQDLALRRRTKLDSESTTMGLAAGVRQACNYKCYCQCHEQAPISRRGFLKLPVKCTESSCYGAAQTQKRLTSVSNFFHKAVAQALSSKSIKLRYDLNTYRTIAEGSDVMRHIKHGRLDKLKVEIASGEATIWDTAPDGWSLLHTAVYNQHLPIVKYLLALGADTENSDVGSRRPADLAFFKSLCQNATQEGQEIVEVFSQKDDFINDFDFTPVHIAVLDLYDISDHERPTLESLIQLIDAANNASVDTNWTKWKSQYSTRSPLFASIIEYFRASAFEMPKESKIIHNLLDRRDKKNFWTPLQWAAAAGRTDKMHILVENGADPFLLSNLNANILHTAAESKIPHGLSVALQIRERYPTRLDINQINRWAETPLHVASWSSPACVKLLLEAGADPDMQQEDGQVPLHCAGLSGPGPDRFEVVSLLCSANSSRHINTQDFDGRAPIFEFLDDTECMQTLIDHGARLDITDKGGRTLFHHACIQGESGALKIILSTGCDSEIATTKNSDGDSPLIEALSHFNVDCALVLLESGHFGDVVSQNGWTAAHYAAKIGDSDLLESVLSHVSFLKGMKTNDGKTVDTIAMEAGHWHGENKALIRKYNSMGYN